MIVVKNLTKSFNQTPAVSDLSFTIKKGQIIGFLGPNGAGKTTTMRLLTGVLAPDSGSIKIDGLSLTQNLQSLQPKIGYLPENNPLYPNLLVSELLELSAQLKGIPTAKLKQNLDFAVSSVSIEDVYFQPIHTLSKGFRQRVGLALALLNQPQILILDEPTEGLDPNQRTNLRKLIKSISKNRTIILSTHVMPEALALANRLLIISKGKIVADSPPHQLAPNTKTTQYQLELEGKYISRSLKSIKSITKLTITRRQPHRYRVLITAHTSPPLEPNLSRLVAKHRWIVWHLQKQSQDLEAIFHQLTK